MENNNSNTDENMQNRTSAAQNDLQDGMAGASQSTQNGVGIGMVGTSQSAQNVAGAEMTLESLEAQEQNVQASQKKLRKKSVMLLVATMLVIAVLVALAIAWYTRVANTYAVTFDVADYDLTMNENVDDEYLLNVYEYAGLTGKTTDTTTGAQHTMMAPGTIGWIPLKISAYHSDVDVTYYISLESKMPEELYKHMRFFVLAEKNPATDKKTGMVTNSKTGQDSSNNNKYAFHYGDAVDKVSDIASYTKIYLDQDYADGKPSTKSDGSTIISDEVKLESSGTQNQGSEKASKTLCIYWEWYWDADEAYKDNAPLVKTDTTAVSNNKVNTEYATNWDNLDTDIGRYPDKYYDAFTMYIKTTGTQVTPTNGQRKTSNNSNN